MSWRQHFLDLAARYGYERAPHLVQAYHDWCESDPSHPTCGSTKSMRAFLQTSSRARGALSSGSVGAPAAIGSRYRIGHSIRTEGDKLIFRGTDLAGSPTTSATPAIGDNLFSFSFYPGAMQFNATRFQTLALMYERWKIRKLQVHYQPNVATSSAGQIILAWDSDPSDGVLPSGADGVREAYSFKDNLALSVWAPGTLKISPSASRDPLFTSVGTDLRLYSAGDLSVLNVGNVPASTTLGTVWLDYEIEFSQASEFAISAIQDLFYVLAFATNVSFASGTVIDAVTAAGSNPVANQLQAMTTSFGKAVILPIGNWMVDLTLNNATTVVASTLQLQIGTFNGNAAYTNTNGSVLDSAVSTSTTAGLFMRTFVSVTAGYVYVTHNFSSYTVAFNSGRLSVRSANLVAPTVAQIDNYPY